MKAFPLMALFLPAAALAEVSVHYYPYDDTEPVTYRLTAAPEKNELRSAMPRIVPAFLCGAYQGRFDLTAGFTLHVFPDNTAMIEEWIDIGLPKIVAEGRWSIGAKGDVIFDWTKRDFESGRSEKFFKEQYGECRTMRLFLCFEDKLVKGVLLVSEEMIGAQIDYAYSRSREYIDWEKIRDELKRKKG